MLDVRGRTLMGVVVEPIHVQVTAQPDECLAQPRVSAELGNGVVEAGVVEHAATGDCRIVAVVHAAAAGQRLESHSLLWGHTFGGGSR